MKLTWLNEKIKQLNEGRTVDDIIAAVSTRQMSKALINDSTISEWEEIVMTAIDAIALQLGEGPTEGHRAIGERFVKAITGMQSIVALFPELEDPSLMETMKESIDNVTLKQLKDRALALIDEVQMSDNDMLYIAKYALQQIVESCEALMNVGDYLDTIEAQVAQATTESKKVVKEEAFDPTFDEFVDVFKDMGFFVFGDSQQGRLHDPLDAVSKASAKAIRLSKVLEELETLRATENVFDSDDTNHQYRVVLSDEETHETFNLNVKVIFDRDGITLEYSDD